MKNQAVAGWEYLAMFFVIGDESEKKGEGEFFR
jgi:hypothetical protein